MSVDIVIINYNSSRDLKKILAVLFIEKVKGFNFKVIVIDNGEFGDNKRLSIRKILEKVPKKQLKFIQNKKNVGFAQAANQGARFALSQYLLFLNPDCKVSLKNIKKLAEIFKLDKKIGAVVPRIVNKNKKTQRWSYGKENPKNDTIRSFHDVKWASGVCFMVKREIFRKLRGFDPKFFFYFEDKDFCLRMKQCGYKIVRYPGVVALHKESGSKIKWSQRKKLYYQAQTYYFKKHYGALPTLIMRILRIPYYVKNVYLSK